MKIQRKRALFGMLAALAIAIAYFRHAGLSKYVTAIPFVGPFLHEHIGTHWVHRMHGRIVYDFVTRGYYQPPPPLGYSGFWNIIPSPRLVRGSCFDTNGQVVASVQNGAGEFALFDKNGELRTIVVVKNGWPAIPDSPE